MQRLTYRTEDGWVGVNNLEDKTISPTSVAIHKLAEFEDFMEENGFESLEELKKRLYYDRNLILDLETIRADKNNPLKPRFYYDENLSDNYFPYAFCARPYDDNMSLHSFMKNGVLCGYASEHYDMWCKNTKPIKEMNFNEWAIKFIMPLIQETQALKNRWQKLKEYVKKQLAYISFYADKVIDALSDIEDKMQELEDGDDIDVGSIGEL